MNRLTKFLVISFAFSMGFSVQWSRKLRQKNTHRGTTSRSSNAAHNRSLVDWLVGGGVRFASGKIQEYRIHRQGLPLKGNHYVLFLKHEEGGDLTILTGYRLHGTKGGA